MTGRPPFPLSAVLLVAAIASTGSSCAGARPVALTSPGNAIPLASTFDQRVGQSNRVLGEPLVVTFERVVEDSRCPVGTSCIWAGDATVRLALRRAGGSPRTLDLHTFSKSADGEPFESYRVHLVALAPAAREGGVPDTAYVATLSIEKR